MPIRQRSKATEKYSLNWILLCLFACALWIAGGASRPDVAGQVLIRGMATIVLVGMFLFSDRIAWSPRRPVATFLMCAIGLTTLQLIPLPPSLWTALPGHAFAEQAIPFPGAAQPWRPWSLAPSATMNALFSLIVPVATWFLVSNLRERETRLLPNLILAVALASTVLGLMQLTGGAFDQPLINDTPGIVSGPFANRNHFAVFLACAVLLIPAWVFQGGHGHRRRWRAPAGLALITLFFLTILATGSRAGTVMGAVAFVFGATISRRKIQAELRRHPRWVSIALVIGALAAIAVFVAISVVSERAVSVERALTVDISQDMRHRGLPVVLQMIRTYYPFGSGIGGFDSIFRLHEPFDLLKPTYFNHAHNDLLEITLDAGLLGDLLMAAAVLWWLYASVRAWRGRSEDPVLSQQGSVMLVLILAASVFDYPARTPIFMAMIVIAASWLDTRARSALPI